MLAEVGTFATALALAAVLYAAFALLRSIQSSDLRWAASGRNGIYAATTLLGLALVLLLLAFMRDQFQIRYVAQHSSRDLAPYLKVSALWAGQDGSLLLWSFLQALFAALVGRGYRRDHYVGWATLLLSLIAAFFVAVTLFLSNPFALLDMVPADGQGLNPLLRHPGMIFHPPALYLGYVGLAVPFAFAMAALITRKVEGWTKTARHWTLLSWSFLGLGLLLGMRWAYDVLGWGGYWGWDPVENAGLMPWLAATALLHGGVMQEERRGFRAWNILLAILSFALVLFGTFTTRSGMIQSVHAFTRSPLGPYFLSAIGLTVVGSLALLYVRRSALAGPHSSGNILSRDGMFLLALILFLTLTASVLIGSLLPTLTSVLTEHQFEAGPTWFDQVTGPQFAGLFLVLGVCPLLGRVSQALARLRSRGWPALVGAVGAVLLAALSGMTGTLPLLGFALLGLAGGTAVAEIVRAAVARSQREGEGLLRSLARVMDRNRRRYGGYLVHLGIILMAVGVIGTRMYPLETDVTLAPGEMTTVGPYTLLFEDLRQDQVGDRWSTSASLSVYRDGAYVVTLQPQMDQYINNSDQPIGLPALRSTLREDLYVVLAGFSRSGATFKVFINSLASFLWLGGLVLLSGGAVALWPSSQAKRLPVPQARRRAAWNSAALLVGLALLAAAGVAMWGLGHGTTIQRSGRPLPGQAAPDFSLALVDGSTLSLSDLRGQVVVVNFWATWCPSCAEELADLQSVWEAHQEQGVAFVGVAYQDDLSDVQRRVAAEGLTYLVGLDQGDHIAAAYGITGVPETFVIDSEGQVVNVYIGPISPQELAAQLDSLLGR